MPQRAREALLQDLIQGLRHPYTPETLRTRLQTTGPQAWAMGAPQTSPPTNQQHTGKRKGKGKAGRKRARRSPR